jgi:hypothetical protein
VTLAALAGVHLVPVRHHSPRSSAVVRAVLDRVRPRAVLVEAPADAEALVAALVDPGTVPPVAILGYRTDGTPGSSLWPFADYSPELVAMRWAAAHGARVVLIDVPVGVAIASHDEGPKDEGEGAPGSGADPDPPAPTFEEAAARARGFRSFEEFWEASFEAPAHEPEGFRAALLAYADLVRLRRRAGDAARDAFMARRIAEVVAGGVAPGEIVVVTGAAHSAAFAAGDVEPAREAELPAAVAAASTIVPYSFPRLAEQTGYGAGNRAPRYYQRAHDAGCDFTRATLEVLVEFSEHLRLRGFSASLADTIEAYRLASTLARHRGKHAPGLDEVREAAIATLCGGVSAHLDGFLWPTVVGRAVGRVAARVGQNSLQEEFWREVRARRLPDQDVPETFALKLANPVEIGTSIFLHRLRISGIPYALCHGTRTASAGPAVAEEAGGQAALARAREVWEAQWTPSTDVALVEKIVLGNGLEQVATRVLSSALVAVTSAGAAAEVLLESAVAGCAETLQTALAACERLAATDDDLPSLAKACRALSGLVSFGTSRGAGLGEQVILSLCERIYERAVLRVDVACRADDAGIVPVKGALRTLHEVALAQPALDRAAWLDAARALADSWAVHPGASGLAAGLLYLADALSDEEVTTLAARRLATRIDPAQGAAFLEGFLEVNALVLVRSRPVVRALDGFLCALPPDRFKDALPVLRRAFGPLGATERRYLLENVVALRGLAGQAAAARAVVSETDKDRLKALDADLSSALDDLDDLL